MDVFVNGRKVSVYRGMSVKHALIAYNQRTYEEAISADVRIEDENGFTLGLEGALAEGARIFVKPRTCNGEHGTES